MTRNYLIQLLQRHGIVQTDFTLNPVFHKRLLANPSLTQHVLEMTSFMRGSVCLKARVHAVIRGLTAQPICSVCGKDVDMRLSGKYRFTYPAHCSNACISNDPVVQARRAATKRGTYYSNDISVDASNTLL